MAKGTASCGWGQRASPDAPPAGRPPTSAWPFLCPVLALRAASDHPLRLLQDSELADGSGKNGGKEAIGPRPGEAAGSPGVRASSGGRFSWKFRRRTANSVRPGCWVVKPYTFFLIYNYVAHT